MLSLLMYILNMKRISVSFVRTARWLTNSRDGEEERTLGVAMANGDAGAARVSRAAH